MNIVERSCRTKPTNVAKEKEIEDNRKAIEVICKSLANHERSYTRKLKKKFTARNRNLPTVSACDGELLLRNIDGKKSTGIDKIQPKLIKLSEKLLSHPLAIAINNSFNK